MKDNPFLDSYIIEFLDLPKNFKESDLRKGLIQNMKDFILEVGNNSWDHCVCGLLYNYLVDIGENYC